MLRYPWRTAAATATLAGASAFLYHRYYYSRTHTPQEFFEYRVRTGRAYSNGRPEYTMKKETLIPLEEVNSRLTSMASLSTVPRPGGLVWKHSTAQLPSNDPIEDAHASLIVQQDSDPSAPNGDYLFFAVMDGHAGPHTSRLLAKTLIPSIALQLHQLKTTPSVFAPDDEKRSYSSYFDKIKGLVGLPFPPKPSHPNSNSSSELLGTGGKPSISDPAYVSLAIQNAFALLDAEIVGAPLRIIAEHLAQSNATNTDKSKLTLDPPPDLSQHPMGMPSMLPALSGSCAMLALLDTVHKDLYVACTGDCRAVAGIWEEEADGTGTGYWRVEVLSEDQTGRNPNELRRLQKEHPGEEETVVKRGRILGGLEPSRAFGDARYKWPFHYQQLLARVFLEGNGKPFRGPPPDFKTPPYVTALPVVTHRKLDFLPSSSSRSQSFSLVPPPVPVPIVTSPTLPPPTSSSTSPSPSLPEEPTSTTSTSSSHTHAKRRPGLRFLILATDGLWDEISPTHAVALVGAHLSGLRTGAISRAALAARVPTRLGAKGVLGKDASVYASQGASSASTTNSNANANANNNNNEEEAGAQAQWTFIDANPSVHLIRNALGGADTRALRRVMSIPAPETRRFRDDVTVTVVWWEEDVGGVGGSGVGVKMGVGVTEVGMGEVGVGMGAVKVKAKL